MTTFEDLLSIAATDPHGEIWSRLHDRLCHQGSCYSDGAELAKLAGVAAVSAPSDRDRVLAPAADVAVDLTASAREVHAAVLVDPRRLLDETLTAPTDPGIFVLQSMLALEGDRTWG